MLRFVCLISALWAHIRHLKKKKKHKHRVKSWWQYNRLTSPFHPVHLGDNCIQICHLGKYIGGFNIGNFVLRRRVPILMHLFIFSVEKIYYLHKAASAVGCVKPNASQWEATLRDDVRFPTVYRRIYRLKFLTLSNQTLHYIRKCIIKFIYFSYFCSKHRLWVLGRTARPRRF